MRLRWRSRLQINWAHLEETVQDMKTYGRPAPKLRSLRCTGLSERAKTRLTRINEAHGVLIRRELEAAKQGRLEEEGAGGFDTGRPAGVNGFGYVPSSAAGGIRTTNAGRKERGGRA